MSRALVSRARRVPWALIWEGTLAATATLAFVLAALAPVAGARRVRPSAARPTALLPYVRAHVAPDAQSFGPSTYVFTPSMPVAEIQQTVNAIAAQQISNQFGPQRYALLFEPGTYGTPSDPLSFQVGYYTEVAGLGQSPADVTIHGTVEVYNQCTNGPGGDCNALDNFWRSLSNLTIDVAGQSGCRSGTDFWAVSQAAPMRRVQIQGGNLSLMDYCSGGSEFSSGGFIADSSFSGGTIVNGSQQQFLVRNSNLDGWTNGVWNQVFSGDIGAPPQSFSSGDPGAGAPYTTLAASPITQEEPYLTDGSAGWQVQVPAAERDSVGPAWQSNDPTTAVPLSRFYIATPSDGAGQINQALRRGLNLLLTPGVYQLDGAIHVTRPNTIVLGLGFPTLIPQDGTAAMRVADVPGVKLAGMIFDAGPLSSPVLLQLGCATASRRPIAVPCGAISGRTADPRARDQLPTAGALDPTAVQDVFFRIGGAEAGSATRSLVVNSSNVILDDIWAWRADHGTGVGWTQNRAANGLTVRGNNVTAYGVAVEHYQKNEVVWSGRNGTDIFFQNEMPYDPPSQAAWMQDATTDGYPAFTVTGSAAGFQGYGMGSYCFFNRGVPIEASTAFSVAPAPGVELHDIFTRFLNASGGIEHVVNGVGAAVTAENPGPSDIVSYP